MLRYALALTFAMSVPAFAQDHGVHSSHSAPAADPAFAAQMQAHEKMAAGMGAVQPSGDPDVDFVRMMIPHHQGAIDMAEAELKFGKDESRKDLARQIIEAQTREIAEMQDWLAKNAK
jgi:uncharacterized protein (DUF305 family)